MWRLEILTDTGYRLSALVLNGGARDDVPLLDVAAGSQSLPAL
jgi:hypothetical protein